MPKKTTPEAAANYLRDIEDQYAFYVNNGPVLKNIQELPNALRKMKKPQFEHHVNIERNDFTNWIKDVIGDSKLAKDLSKVKTKPTTSKKVRARITALKKLAKKK